jgi:two-component system, LytTR family, response regulator
MANNLRCLIIDDEPLAIDVIENYLQRLNVSDIQRCGNAVDAFQLYQEQPFDLIFLDIEMPVLTGLDFLKSIKNPPDVIITTAYREYAVEGYEFEVLDYLLKPISFPRFMKAMERAMKPNRGSQKAGESDVVDENEYLFLKVDRRFVKILIKDILYIESLKDYIKVKTKAESWISYQSLTSITEKLSPEKFMRIHRSFTIALEKVSVVEGNCVVIDGTLIPISRELKQEVVRKICK